MTGLELTLSVVTLLGFIYIVLQHQLIKNMEDLEKAYERYIQSLKDNKERMTKLTDTRHMLTSKHINILKKDRSTLEWKLDVLQTKLKGREYSIKRQVKIIQDQRLEIKHLEQSIAILELNSKRDMKTIQRERDSRTHMWSAVVANCKNMDKMQQQLRPIEDLDRALQWWKEQYHNKAKQFEGSQRIINTLQDEIQKKDKEIGNKYLQ